VTNIQSTTQKSKIPLSRIAQWGISSRHMDIWF